MKTTDKVIKNTYYHFISQVIGFFFPLILIPLIISKIGSAEFGIYTIAYGFIGAFTLFDLGISTSYIKFISEYYNKNEIDNLNSTINVGIAFYLVFTIVFAILGFLFANTILSYINIPPDLIDKGRFALYICLIIFVIATNSNMFVSILLSLQKMYVNSLLSMGIGVLNFIMIIVVLFLGYGIKGLLYVQLITVTVSTVLSIILAKKYLPQVSYGIKYFKLEIFKKMMKFGLQMQISKLAGFFSEKYDEFLLGVFSILNNVTFFNISAKIMRVAKFLPMLFLIQVAPVAAELNAKEQKEKLKTLFEDTTKYLSFVSIPISIYVFIFSNEIISTWMGSGFEISSYILRILLVGMLVNLIIASPGNSILPNIGIPKYQMFEGLFHLIVNVVISYFLIKNYGLVGAAYGNSAATIISSVYIFIISVKYFNRNIFSMLWKDYLLPVFTSVFAGLIIYIGLKIVNHAGFYINNRIEGTVFLAISVLIFSFLYTFIILNTNYFNERNLSVLTKILLKVFPKSYFENKKFSIKEYNGELISIVVITYNKIEALKLCLNSLLESAKNIKCEIIIWNNNSTDGTAEFLEKVSSENNNIKVINNDVNLGNNAKSKAFELTKGNYIIGIDDDVIEFPENWIQNMVKAYKSVPFMGYLVSDVIQDDKTNGAKFSSDRYIDKEYFNRQIVIQSGPAGGWCFMVSREVYNETGKLLFLKNRKFIPEDSDYQTRIINGGFVAGILKDTKVYHATGEFYNSKYGNPLQSKYTEAKEPLPVAYRIARKIKNILRINRKIRMIKRILISQYNIENIDNNS